MSDNGHPFDPSDPLLAGIEEALGKLGISEEGARRSLLEGVREALGEFIEVDGAPMQVRVIDGGRAEDDDAPRPPAPDLRIAEVGDDEDLGPTRVRVVRVGAPQAQELPPLVSEGRIRIEANDAAPHQTIYRGEAIRAYRVCCDQGSLEVSVDGTHAGMLGVGQSLDVEGRVVRVHSNSVGTGRYIRL
ncbi:MAG: hypothetical protein H6741_35490 [Alphaproteobacteria bacterium]|nr:hypothetical protein [Alphaproteobacteria bacterium]MCB9798012.1 hypothetical protein [Alphaproteobacteria bacterium]